MPKKVHEDSSGEEDSIEELNDRELDIKRSKYPWYNKKEPIPKFEIGMKFNGKRQFKKAVIKQRLVERSLIKFIENEAGRMIAKCDWRTYHRRCMASVNSRCSSWQIASMK